MKSNTLYSFSLKRLPFKRFPLRPLVYFCLITAYWLFAPLAQSEPSLSTPTVAKATDVRVVIDISGSMKKNDPANLRQPALELLLQLLPATSKAGVWTFGQYVNMLVPHGEVNDDWKAKASGKAVNIRSNGLFTNIGEALEKAAYDQINPKPDYQTHIILLTDGMVDIDKNSQKNQLERERILQRVLPEIGASGYTLHTIALSDHADKELLDHLALTTGGVSAVAHTADELMKVFLRIFDQTAPAEQLPLSNNRFLVDSSIEEFTALIFREPGSPPTRLVSPEGTEYQFEQKAESVSWYRTDQYDLVTIQQPMEGEWSVLADVAPDSRITIVSNLNLFVNPLPNNVFWDQALDLSLRMQDQEGVITDADFLQLLTITGAVHQLDQKIDQKSDQEAGLQADQKEVWQQLLSKETPPSDGIYSASLDVFHEAARYKLSVVVDGKSFQRQLTHYLQAREVAGMQPPAEQQELQPVEEPQPVKEPQPVEEPQPVKKAEPETAPEPTQEQPEEESTLPTKIPDWLLYAVIGGGNLVLLFIAFLAYRLVMGTGKDDSLKELEQAVTEAETDTDDTPSEATTDEAAAKNVAKEAAGTKDEQPPEQDDDKQGASDDDIAPIEMDIDADQGLMADLDLSSDKVTEAQLAMDENEQAFEQAGSEQGGSQQDGSEEDRSEQDRQNAEEVDALLAELEGDLNGNSDGEKR